jgi:hypothetical protein
MQADPSMSKGSAKGKKRAKKGKSLDITRQAPSDNKARHRGCPGVLRPLVITA